MAAFPALRSGLRLEGVLDLELNVARSRAGICDLAEVGVSEAVVGVAVAGDVESVEEVGAEIKPVLVVDGEGFLRSEIEVEEARRAKRTRANVAKAGEWLWRVGARPVVSRIAGCRIQGAGAGNGGIRSEPVREAAAGDLDRAKLFGPSRASVGEDRV